MTCMSMLADSSSGLDAVTYFFANSGLFFLVTALLFFGFGTLFGAATWGRYKRRYEKSEEVIEANRAELAQLKRRLAEREKSGRAAAAPQPTVFTPPSFNPPAVHWCAVRVGQGRHHQRSVPSQRSPRFRRDRVSAFGRKPVGSRAFPR